ncbi:MAG: InlB B-repeat-containing protein [Oscillospiraceae bacterium]|nr:InlB B-repeat-containing protein [Oscillospiraceae bacterium]
MNIKKLFAFLLAVALVLPVCGISASAEEEMEFRYELTIDGKELLEVDNGDMLTVTLYLYRTDENEIYSMHAMQDEIRYDRDFFELVEDSVALYDGVQSTDIELVDNHKELYMNFLSFAGGELWGPKVRVGSFQLRVIGTSGVSRITNEDFLVSLPDGSGSYRCVANDVVAILSTDCVVKFETNGGAPIDPITAIYGELITRPADPVREGKHLEGWYRDIHLTEKWDFENDRVDGNMTLYAKWLDGEPGSDSAEPDGAWDGLCLICGKERESLFGMPICWLCMSVILLAVLIILFFIFREQIMEKIKKNRNSEPQDLLQEEDQQEEDQQEEDSEDNQEAER